MAEARDLKVKRGKLLKAAEAFVEILINGAQSEPEHMAGRVGREEHAAMFGPQERQLSRAMARNMNGPESARQHLAVMGFMVDFRCLDRGRGPRDQKPCHERVKKSGGRRKGAFRHSRAYERGIERVHGGRRSGRAFDFGQAPRVVAMGVRDENLPQITRFTADRVDRAQNLGRTSGDSRIDQDEPIVRVEKKRVDEAEPNLPEAGNNLCRSHSCAPQRDCSSQTDHAPSIADQEQVFCRPDAAPRNSPRDAGTAAEATPSWGWIDSRVDARIAERGASIGAFASPRFAGTIPGAFQMDGRKPIWFAMALTLMTLVLTPSSPAGENVADQWDKKAAARYLDQRGDEWYRFSSANRGEGETATSCISCHSLLPYALARPALRRVANDREATKWESRVLEQTKRRVANWSQLDEPEFQLFYDFNEDKKKQSRGTESVLNALVLALDDRFQGRREASVKTQSALAILWSTQLRNGPQKGAWNWLNFGLEPWESTQGTYLGACLAAIAVGSVSEGQSSIAAATTGRAKDGVTDLRAYLKTHRDAQNLHNKIWLLWASSVMDGLVTPAEKSRLVDEILAKQQSDGGFSLGSLGDFTHVEIKSPPTTPDAYATGLALHALQLAGLSKDDPRVSKGLAWLRANQDRSGAWRAASVNKVRAPESANPAKANVGKFMWDAATGYAVLALSH